MQTTLCVKWSPEQISDHLAAVFPDRQEMRVSPEAIYQALYVGGRGDVRGDLHQHLRTGRAIRRPRRPAAKNSGKIPDMIMISERPDLPRAFRTAELVVSSTLPMLAVDNHNGLHSAGDNRVRSAGVDCCKTLRYI